MVFQLPRIRTDDPLLALVQENVRKALELHDVASTAPGMGTGANNKLVRGTVFRSAGPVYTVRIVHNLGRLPTGVVPIHITATGAPLQPFAYYETERTTEAVTIYSEIDAVVSWWIF